MRHVEIAVSASSRVDIEQRLTGRFYTPIYIADCLAKRTNQLLPNPSSVGDPFCGDGRLIAAWLKANAASDHNARRSLRRIVLWDFDSAAVTDAKLRIMSQLRDLGWTNCKVEALTCDTFERVQSSIGSIDLVLTNPPWELLKPDSRDGLDSNTEFKEHLRGYASTIARSYPGALSAKGKAMTGYGVNLARAGAIASAMLTKDDGLVAIVLPSSIFADQASIPFRQEFFRRLSVLNISWYPAEARLFAGVDQPFVTVIGRAGEKTVSFVLARHDKGTNEIESRSISFDDFSRPVAFNVGGDAEKLVTRLGGAHPMLHSLESDSRYGLWLGRELDETRWREYLTDDPKGVPFIKGLHVFPFKIVRDQIWRIDPKRKVIPCTTQRFRFAWRDVSRPNQRRRMHVALVPDGNITGNSLGVGYFREGPAERALILMAVMNSMVFELQVRTHLATVHVSQGILRKCGVPLALFENARLCARLLDLVGRRLKVDSDLPELEIEVAKAYGLGREEFATVLDAFPKLTVPERNAHLIKELWY